MDVAALDLLEMPMDLEEGLGMLLRLDERAVSRSPRGNGSEHHALANDLLLFAAPEGPTRTT